MSEVKDIDGFKVYKCQIFSGAITFSVFEKTNLQKGFNGDNSGLSHSTIMSWSDLNGPEGQWYGRLGMRHLPKEIDIIPVGEARFAACDKHRNEQYELAYSLIKRAYPEVEKAEKKVEQDGEISIRSK